MSVLFSFMICVMFVIVTVPTTAAAIELIKCRKLLERTNELLESIARK